MLLVYNTYLTLGVLLFYKMFSMKNYQFFFWSQVTHTLQCLKVNHGYIVISASFLLKKKVKQLCMSVNFHLGQLLNYVS